MTTNSHTESIAVVRPESARLDAITGRELVRQLRPYVEVGADIVLDLQHVDFINSEALGYITMSCRRIHHRRGRLKVCGLRPEPHRVFQVTRLSDLLDGVHETEQQAIAALCGSRE